MISSSILAAVKVIISAFQFLTYCMAAALLASAVALLSSYVVLFVRSCSNCFGLRTTAKRKKTPAVTVGTAAAARYKVKAIGEGQFG